MRPHVFADCIITGKSCVDSTVWNDSASSLSRSQGIGRNSAWWIECNFTHHGHIIAKGDIAMSHLPEQFDSGWIRAVAPTVLGVPVGQSMIAMRAVVRIPWRISFKVIPRSIFYTHWQMYTTYHVGSSMSNTSKLQPFPSIASLLCTIHLLWYTQLIPLLVRTQANTQLKCTGLSSNVKV